MIAALNTGQQGKEDMTEEMTRSFPTPVAENYFLHVLLQNREPQYSTLTFPPL